MRELWSMHLCVALIATCFHLSRGFAVQSSSFPSSSYRRPTHRNYPHYAAWNDNEDVDGALRQNMARTCVRTFLTQRAIQSFMFLLESCRDPHTVKWFEETFGFQSLDQYHGTGAFNFTKYETWDSVLLDILWRPKQVIVIQAKRRGRGHGGWSKNNPYLPDRFVEFEIDIDPPSLVSRILSVRDQIASEFVEDLATMKSVNEKILDSYFNNQAKARDNRNASNASNTLDAPTRDGSSDKQNVYTRDAMFMLSNTMASYDQRSSPYRGGNFDLMVLLTTQESVHRVLREYRQAGSEREVSFVWFRDYYVQRVADYFDGQQSYGRADDFLEELLLTPPSFKTQDNVVALIDPLRIAEDIIRKRSLVADEWKDIMSNIGSDHMDLRKAILIRQTNPSGTEETQSTLGEFSSDIHFE